MVKTRKHRSSTRKIKKGGGRNWRPNRSKSKPMYLNSQIKIVKDLKKYYKSDVLDLSTYQKRIIEGTDEEKEEARADLKDIRFYLRNLKDNLRSWVIDKVKDNGGLEKPIIMQDGTIVPMNSTIMIPKKTESTI